MRWQREYVQWSIGSSGTIGHAYVHRTFQSSIGSNGQAHVHWTFDLSIGSNGQEYVHWTFGCAVNKLFRMTSYMGINPMQVSRPVRWQREYVQWSIGSNGSIGHAYVHWTFQLCNGSNGCRDVHWTFDLSIGSNGQEDVH
jgi:hypothetical protein